MELLRPGLRRADMMGCMFVEVEEGLEVHEDASIVGSVGGHFDDFVISQTYRGIMLMDDCRREDVGLG